MLTFFFGTTDANKEPLLLKVYPFWIQKQILKHFMLK